VSAAKRNFVTLQDAWDAPTFPRVKGMMTDEMLGEIRTQLAEREPIPAGSRTRPTS
jgi:hypothetical protein